ncbi:MAG: M3 family oligoendopeptidase [Phycisphaerales bacterium]
MSTTISDFVPADLDGRSWAALEPLYTALLARPINSTDDLERLLLDRSELDATTNQAHAELYIAMTCQTDDETAKSGYLDFVENVEPKLKQASFDLDQKIAGSEHAGSLDAERYGVLLRDMRADVNLFREENIALQTEDTKLGQQYSTLCGEMIVDFRGEKKTPPQMSPFFEETDRATREEAWRGVAEVRHAQADRFSGIFDEMIQLRTKIAANAGFSNYRDYAFVSKHRFDYGPDACADFHRAAEEVCVPVVQELDAQRAEALGLERLRPWDLSVDPHGREPLRPFDGAEDLIARTSKLFHRLDGGLGTMFDSMRDGTSLDLEARPGKAPGGYQENRDRVRKPFIFMNAAGTQRDLDTMIHEAGHAFHSMLSADEPIVDYRHPPIEFAEVASMSMELLAQPHLAEFYSDAEIHRARRMHLEGLIRFLPWCATVDAFQHWLYTNPDHSQAERTEFWLSLIERFSPGLDWTGLEHFRETSWQRQLHLFEVPFYYIEYGIAQLGALQLWLQSRESTDRAIANYRRAMSLGGSRPLPELFGAAELTFDFGPGTVGTLITAVRDELATLPI